VPRLVLEQELRSSARTDGQEGEERRLGNEERRLGVRREEEVEEVASLEELAVKWEVERSLFW